MALKGDWSPELLTALSPISGPLRDPAVTEIAVNGYNEVWAKGTQWRGWRREDARGWEDIDDFRVACIRVSDVIGRLVNARRPLLNARLPGGERVNIVLAPACAKIALTVRKFPAETMTLERLERLGTLGPSSSLTGATMLSHVADQPKTQISGRRMAPLRAICEALVLARVSIIVAGGTNAGKTSLLNALTQVIPAHERIVTIEDARELQVQQPNWVSLETVESDGEEPGITIADLVRNSLRMTPDRIIVGEVRGKDALDLLRALSTGHGGGFGTVHASSALDALMQLQVLAQMASPTMQAQVVAALVSRAVDVVIYEEFFEDEGVRRVSEVIELERPGLRLEGHGLEYCVRNLVRWNEATATWEFPDGPSARLRRALRRVGDTWPDGGAIAHAA